MERPGIRIIRACPPHQYPSPLKQLQKIVGFLLRIACAFLFIFLVHYCITKESTVRKGHVQTEVAEINPSYVVKNSPKLVEKQDLVDCPGQSQDDLIIQLRECRETAKLNNLMDIRKFRNRANIYECQVACLYPVAKPNLYESVKSYIQPTPKLNPEDPKILIEDVPKDLTSNWKFDPQLTILHFEFHRIVLPAAVIFEYSSDLRSLFWKQELRVKLIGIIHNSEESLLQAQHKIGVFVKQVQIDDYLLEKKDEFSRYHDNDEQTIMARIMNYPDEIQYFNAIRIEIYSSGEVDENQNKDFSFSRIKIMEVQ